MKGCFILQRRFAYLGHEMVRELMTKYGLVEACAYVQTRESFIFLQKQHDVPYTALILDEDIYAAYKDEELDMTYLQKLEQDYGIPTLWQYINADRIVRSGQLLREYPYDERTLSHEDMLRLVQVYAKKVAAFLDAENPDFIFGPQIASLGTLLLAHMAKKRGVKTFFIMNSGVESLTCVGLKRYSNAIKTYRFKTFLYMRRRRSISKLFVKSPLPTQASTSIHDFAQSVGQNNSVFCAPHILSAPCAGLEKCSPYGREPQV